MWDGAEADERSDIYAVGVTLYFLLTGRVPFEGDAPTAIMLAQLEHNVIPPSARLGEPLPAGLDVLVLRAMAKRPADRYQSALELRQALDAIPAAWTPADAEAFWRKAERAAAPPPPVSYAPVTAVADLFA